MSRLRKFFLLILLVGSAQSAPLWNAHATSLEYQGERHDPETVARARGIVEPLIPEAVARAESLLEMTMDLERLEIQLLDLPARKGDTTFKMRVRGVAHPILLIYVEPLLRGDFPDLDSVRRTLTHELIHALVRQNLDHALYRRLPVWFQEGVPHFLLGQTDDKMLIRAAVEYENPYAVLGGFEGDHFAVPTVTGGFFFAEMEALIGREGILTFIEGVLAEGSIDRGLEAVLLLDAEMSEDERREAKKALWAGARSRAVAALDHHTQEVAGVFFECKKLYDEGKRDKGAAAVECFENLIASHPASYAAEVAGYWLAKSRYRRHEYESALTALDLFDAHRLNYGLLDNSRYLRIRIYEEMGRESELLEACREYIKFFPDGADYSKVRDVLK